MTTKKCVLAIVPSYIPQSGIRLHSATPTEYLPNTLQTRQRSGNSPSCKRMDDVERYERMVISSKLRAVAIIGEDAVVDI